MADLSQIFGAGAGQGPQPDFNSLYAALQQAQSPYLTMGAHGYLQDRHPRIAQALDNAFMNVAEMPQTANVSGAGDNIAAVVKGLAGARQAQQQHAIQQATLPLQVAQQSLGYQKNLWDLLKDRSEVGMYDAHAKYYKQLGDYKDYVQNDKPIYNSGGPKIDDNGEPWMFNQRSGQNEYVGDNPDVANNPNYKATFLKGGKPGAGHAGALNLLGLAQTATGGDPATSEGANSILNLYSNVQAGIAGRKAASTDKAHQPAEDEKNFLETQKHYVGDMIGKPPSEAEQKDLDAKQQLLSVLGKDSFEKFYGKGSANFDYKSLQNRQADFANKSQQARNLLSQYIKSGAHRKGIGIQDWVKSQQPAQAAPTQQNATPDLGSALDQIFPRQP